MDFKFCDENNQNFKLKQGYVEILKKEIRELENTNITLRDINTRIYVNKKKGIYKIFCSLYSVQQMSKNKKEQIRKKDRTEVAKEVRYTGGSALAFVEKEINEKGIKNVP